MRKELWLWLSAILPLVPGFVLVIIPIPIVLIEILWIVIIFPDAAGTAGVERCGDNRLYDRHEQPIAAPIAIDFLRFDHLAVLTAVKIGVRLLVHQ